MKTPFVREKIVVDIREILTTTREKDDICVINIANVICEFPNFWDVLYSYVIELE